MKMDLLYWKRRASQTDVLQTTKLFYKTFLYKMTVFAPGCRSILCPDIAGSLRSRKELVIGHYNYGGSWYSPKVQEWVNQADITQLTTLQEVRGNSHKHNIKVRVQEPYVDIYACTEEKLKELCELLDDPSAVTSVSGPQSKQAETLLVDNKILRKRKPKWRYKIALKDKKLSRDTKKSLWDYLSRIDEEIHMPSMAKHQLTKDHDWIWGCYFYTNDPGIVNMIQLIDPDMIREVSELVQVGNK